MTRRGPRLTGQVGLFRGCCLGLILLLVVIGVTAFCADRALAAPDLGAPPAGPDDGSGQTQIAVTLGVQLAAKLIATPHGAVTLSERDLTVLAQAHNPHPDRYTNLTVRARDKLLVISADDHFGPFKITPVLHVTLALQGSNASDVAVHAQQLDVGQLPLPGGIRDHFLGELPSVVSIPSLFGANQALQALSSNIECVLVSPGGLVIGVHRPGTPADSSTCGAARP